MTYEDVDPQLVELSRRVDDFVDLTMKQDSDYAILCIGAKIDENASSENEKLQTCLAAGGKLDTIEEALYAEIAHQILNGDARLFFMLSNVVASLDEQLGEQIQELEDAEDKDLLGDGEFEEDALVTSEEDTERHIPKPSKDFLGEFDLDSLEGLIIVEPETNRKH